MWLKHLLIIVICEDASQTFQMRQSGQKQNFVSEQVTVKLDNMQNISTKLLHTIIQGIIN